MGESGEMDHEVRDGNGETSEQDNGIVNLEEVEINESLVHSQTGYNNADNSTE